MKILESKFVKGFIKMADDGYQQGWHERNRFCHQRDVR